MRQSCSVRGVIFDLDGTLIDSRLDFEAMRREMEFAEGQPILEGIERLPPGPRRDQCLEILHRHERCGAENATLILGARELLAELSRRELPTGILTRNSRSMTELALSRLDLQFNRVLTRDDAPPKPDPAGLLRICREWGFPVEDVLFVGDYLFDLQCGHEAGIRTVLYAPNGPPDYSHLAHAVIESLPELVDLFVLTAAVTIPVERTVSHSG